MDQLEFDLFSTEMREAPYAFYGLLRRRAPVHHFVASDTWTVARRAETIAVLRQPSVFSSVGVASIEGTLLGADPPRHTGARRIVNPSFSAAGIAALEPLMRRHARALLPASTAMVDWDLMAGFAKPFPIRVMADLLGIAEVECPQLGEWADDVVSGGAEPSSPERAQVEQRGQWAEAFFADYAERMASEPATGGVGAVLSAALASGALQGPEVIDLAKVLVIAGSETTTNLIGNATAALLQHRESFDHVRKDSAAIPAFIEEVLRYDTPAQNLLRRTTQATELCGVAIPEGALIMVLLGSANRDEAFFSEADAFRVARSPNDHLAFGVGPHFCIGARLARVGARIAFEELLENVPRSARLSTPEVPVFRSSNRIRALERLRISVQ
jgi:cytochrome P450